jgi:chaperone modulatory protein CbpM
VSYPIVPAARLDLASFARAAGLHPDLVSRYVALGLLESTPDATGGPSFAPQQLLVVARIQRLRAGFALNYAAVGLVADLLDRITELEAALRSRSRPQAHPRAAGGRTWTPTS